MDLPKNSFTFSLLLHLLNIKIYIQNYPNNLQICFILHKFYRIQKSLKISIYNDLHFLKNYKILLVIFYILLLLGQIYNLPIGCLLDVPRCHFGLLSSFSCHWINPRLQISPRPDFAIM